MLLLLSKPLPSLAHLLLLVTLPLLHLFPLLLLLLLPLLLLLLLPLHINTGACDSFSGGCLSRPGLSLQICVAGPSVVGVEATATAESNAMVFIVKILDSEQQLLHVGLER
jgi:hypothetical protein